MSLPEITTREKWLAARTALLAKEKEMTRARDALNAERRRLPMVEVTKDYRFEGPDGEVGLLDLFEGRRQLIVKHFMFDPEWDEGCASCTAGTDEMAGGLLDHLHARDTTLAQVSRAPLAKLRRYAATRGWTVPWYSSFGSDFNYDFDVTLDRSVKPPVYNYRPIDMEGEMPGQSHRLSSRRRARSSSRCGRRARRRAGSGSGEMTGQTHLLRDGAPGLHT